MGKLKTILAGVGVIALIFIGLLILGSIYYSTTSSGATEVNEWNLREELDDPPLDLPLPNCDMKNASDSFEDGMRSEMPEQMVAEAYVVSIKKDAIFDFYEETLSNWSYDKHTYEKYGFKYYAISFEKDDKLALVMTASKSETETWLVLMGAGVGQG